MIDKEKYKNMYQDKVTLCGSNAYEKKYYLNPDFNGLPEQIKQELQIACVLFTAEVGGILTLEFDEDGKLNFVTHVEENDFFYDEIGSELMGLPEQIKQELQIACVLFTAEVGGVLTLEFDEEGKLNFVTHVEDNDFFYDEIGSELMIKKLRQEKQDFWESLELYYRIFLLGEDEV